MIEADIELILRRNIRTHATIIVRGRFRRSVENIWRRVTVEYGLRSAVETVHRNGVIRKRGAAVDASGHAGRTGIKDRLREHAALLRAGRHRARAHHACVEASALPIDKEKGLVLSNRPAEHETVLVTTEEGLGTGGREQVTRVELLIAEELEKRSVQAV